MTHTSTRAAMRRPWARRLAAGAALLAALAPAACSTDDILEPGDPDRLAPENLDRPEFLPVILAGAVRDFTVAYVGNTAADIPGQALWSGLLADEFYLSGTFNDRRDLDMRAAFDDNAGNTDTYLLLSRARRAALRAAERYAALDSTDAPGRAEVTNLAGFTYVYFAENYCSGVPFSEYDEATDEFTFGAPETTEQILERSLATFDGALAIAEAAGDDDQRYLAMLGRGRTLLNMNRPADAAAAVAAVPTTFRYVVELSGNTDAQNNAVWGYSNDQGRWSVANREGNNGLPYREAFEAGDTRVPHFLAPEGDPTRLGFNRNILRYQQMKYPTRESSVPVATGVEARLIEAEAALQAGNANWLNILNALRANTSLYACPTGALGCVNRTAPLPALGDPGTAAARQDLLFQERALWLYGTAHRLGDMRRLVRHYGRAIETVYPTGAYVRPGPAGPLTFRTFGTDVSFPIPVDEQNNPELPDNYSCDNTTA